jgi:hypoxanthine-DNA glycosylase
METAYITHTLSPVFNQESRVLILGTMPSPKSREAGFYYGHPRNRFWMVLSDILGEAFPQTRGERIALVRSHRIALWDVLAGCDICGADDSSIKNPKANDLRIILAHSEVKTIFTTGTKAFQLYRKYCFCQTGIEALPLPSTSPANCRVSYEELKKAYQVIRDYL